MNKIILISVMTLAMVNAYGAPSKGYSSPKYEVAKSYETYEPKYIKAYENYEPGYVKTYVHKYEPVYGYGQGYGYDYHEPVYAPHYGDGLDKHVYGHYDGHSGPYDYFYAKSLHNDYYEKKQYPALYTKKVYLQTPYSYGYGH